ncbi:hypothetical protein PF011_g25816 [Phytophthora fragariae]|uniref:Uncharacterized protein n=1 Tax=Phytophthora fragariae TaxID=53985 RepID=A0A6A3HW72_9STRA|nr:hypothetical protein PF011_g25816 [Phytophthora fragariae]
MSVTVSDGTLYTDLNGFVARQPGVRLCTGSGESGRRPRGDGGAPTDDGNGVGEHLNETESLFDSVAKQYITEGMVMRGIFFFNLTIGEFPPNVGLTMMQELSKQRLEARLSHLYAEEEHATLS